MSITIEQLTNFLDQPSNVFKITADDHDSINQLLSLGVEGNFNLQGAEYLGTPGNTTREIGQDDDLIKCVVVATRMSDINF